MRREQLPLSLGPEIYLRFQLGTDERIFNPALPRDVWIRAISNMQNAYTGAPKRCLPADVSCHIAKLATQRSRAGVASSPATSPRSHRSVACAWSQPPQTQVTGVPV